MKPLCKKHIMNPSDFVSFSVITHKKERYYLRSFLRYIRKK